MYGHGVALPETCKRKCGGDFNSQHVQWFFGNPDPSNPESRVVRTVLDQLHLSIPVSNYCYNSLLSLILCTVSYSISTSRRCAFYVICNMEFPHIFQMSEGLL